jgi:hypothetical protein
MASRPLAKRDAGFLDVCPNVLLRIEIGLFRFSSITRQSAMGAGAPEAKAHQVRRPEKCGFLPVAGSDGSVILFPSAVFPEP